LTNEFELESHECYLCIHLPFLLDSHRR